MEAWETVKGKKKGQGDHRADSEDEGLRVTGIEWVMQVGGVWYMHKHSGGLLISAELPLDCPWTLSH